jgi:hypothetical protein
MPALYIPKAGTFDGLISQLETLRAVSPENYASLQQKYLEIKNEEKPENPVTLLQITALALNNEDFKQRINAEYTRLKQAKPEQKERFELSQWQAEVKAVDSLERRGLNLEGRKDYTAHLNQRLLKALKKSKPHANGKDVLRTLQADAKTLHRMLTPSVKITRNGLNVTETPYNMAAYLQNPPDIIFIMGNNDLRQVDFIGELYHMARGISPDKFPKIYVSGFGGHGTMHNPVFALQEAQTMIKRLLDLGVPRQHIQVERDAVDTGRNVKYMDIFILAKYALKNQVDLQVRNLLNAAGIEFLKQIQALQIKYAARTPEQEEILEKILAPIRKHVVDNNISIFNNILVSGTPGGLRRQTSTVEQQKVLPWTNITCLAPHEFIPEAHADLTDNEYYNERPKALINFIYALREVASYIDYTLNTEFLSKRPLPDLNNLRDCIYIYAEYYNLIREAKYNPTTQQTVIAPPVDGNRLADLFIEFSQQKSRGEKNPGLIAELNTMIKPTADYFRRAFLDVEIEKLKQINLRKTTTVAEQARALDTSGTYSRQELFTHNFFTRPNPSEQVETSVDSQHEQKFEYNYR